MWWQVVSGAQIYGDIPDIADLTHDSRLVRPGSGFAAVPGFKTDGHDYIQTALTAGAAAALVQADHKAKWAQFLDTLPLVVVPDVRAALGPLASAVHGEPSKTLRLIGVTGTDGKTTTTHLTAHVLDACGLSCGYLTSGGFNTGAIEA